jgi:GTPase Era involved in 16S rRNA processing
MTPQQPTVPEFAVLGHPNEGKSSLVSTLTEDDSVRISAFPGETTECRVFPVIIDGQEVIRFTDTPGFQAPRQTLAWFESYDGHTDSIVQEFIRQHRDNPLFKDEIELLAPIARGAGIIYVADGSRPLRSTDRAEMNILSRTGRPRIAIINNKNDETRFNRQWEEAFRDHFDTVTHFNAHHASYRERIFLLETIGRMRNDLTVPLSTVIETFKSDWSRRNQTTVELILNMVESCLGHTVQRTIRDKSLKEKEKNGLIDQWVRDITGMEAGTHQQIRALFKHNIFNILLPEHSVLSRDLFDSQTWRLLGLTRAQLAATAATLGGAAAAIIDLAAAGHSLGLFTLLGGAAGAGSALLGAKRIARVRLLGKTLGGYTITVGPHRDLGFMFVLLDRALLFYSHIINWAHGKRTEEPFHTDSAGQREGNESLTAHWPRGVRNDILAFYSALKSQDASKRETAKKQAADTLKSIVDAMPYRK